MLRIILFSMLLMCMAGCSRQAPPEDVDKAAGLFFQRLNEADYDTIYKDASTQFKTNKTRDVVVESLKELTAKGKLQDFRRTNTSYRDEGKDRIAMPVFGTTFEQARGDITLSFIDEDGEWKLIAFAFKQRS
jgi:hypothetical protein